MPSIYFVSLYTAVQRAAMKSLIRFIVGSYLLAPRVFVGHIVSVGIFYGLAKESADAGQLVSRVVKHEAVQLLLWLVLPAEGLAITLSLLFCLWLCRSASVGKRVEVYDKATLTTGQ